MSARDFDHVGMQMRRDAAKLNALPAPLFAQLPLQERLRLARAAREAHPINGEHRRRWIRARLWLDAYGIEPHVALGKGVGQSTAVREISRWEKAARAAC